VDFGFTPEQTAFKASIEQFAIDVVAPRAAAIDESGIFPTGILKEAAGLGLLGVTIPRANGGAGRDYLSYALAIEAVARVSATVGAKRSGLPWRPPSTVARSPSRAGTGARGQPLASNGRRAHGRVLLWETRSDARGRHFNDEAALVMIYVNRRSDAPDQFVARAGLIRRVLDVDGHVHAIGGQFGVEVLAVWKASIAHVENQIQECAQHHTHREGHGVVQAKWLTWLSVGMLAKIRAPLYCEIQFRSDARKICGVWLFGFVCQIHLSSYLQCESHIAD